MAQDLHAAFGLGDSDKSIGMQDIEGVALAAIQGLHQQLARKSREIAKLTAKVAEVETLKGKLRLVVALRLMSTCLTPTTSIDAAP